MVGFADWAKSGIWAWGIEIERPSKDKLMLGFAGLQSEITAPTRDFYATAVETSNRIKVK